jgi:predicted hotdog family 3-hydroxylacyl-ACP dehydratase
MTSLVLDRRWLISHLPHQGAMNLLANVISWDAQGLKAIASSHRDASNPLRRGSELPIACGIEYGAQAVAAHGALLSPNGISGSGFLASARAVTFHATRLDDVEADLEVVVAQIGGGAGGMLYRFSVGAQGIELLEGRLAIVLDVFRSQASA